jgi:putative restriction endonuclease
MDHAEAAAFDAAVRQAAFDRVRDLARHGELTSERILEGFTYAGERWPLVNPQRGIFKPRKLPFLLSIRTVVPRPGGRVRYDDQIHAHGQIFSGKDVLDYAFMGTDPAAPENVWLRQAAQQQVPIIYFLGVAPGLYHGIIPTFVVDWDGTALRARIAFGEIAGATATAPLPDATERRYALRLVKQRLHQASFRERVLTAYDRRCAITGLPEERLVDAAHIMADPDELLGQPVVANGLALSKLHHAAFDQHLLGIDPDGRVHVADRLLELHDGPLLEQGLKAMAGRVIRPPRDARNQPDRDRLEARYELFRRAA